MITDPVVLAYVWAAVPRLQPGERLFHASTRVFRTEFHRLIQLTRLSAFMWPPYSLSRGGATARYMEFGNLSRALMRGRWALTKTTRFYKKSAAAAAACESINSLNDACDAR